MASIFDVSKSELIEELAKELTKLPECKPPEWSGFVKTAHFKERPPIRRDWWYVRTASVLRFLYEQGPLGVSKLRIRYGGKKSRGVRPERFYKASGNIIRKILQQLEKAELTKQAEKGVHKGRIITPKGRSLVDKVAQRLRKPPVKKPEAKKDERARRDKEKKA